MSEWVMSARPTEHVPCTSCKCGRLHQSIILRQLSQGWGLLLTHRVPGRVCQGLVMSGGAVFDLFRWLLHHVGVERSKLSSSEWSSGKGWSRQGVMGDANGVPHSQTPPRTVPRRHEFWRPVWEKPQLRSGNQKFATRNSQDDTCQEFHSIFLCLVNSPKTKCHCFCLCPHCFPKGQPMKCNPRAGMDQVH